MLLFVLHMGFHFNISKYFDWQGGNVFFGTICFFFLTTSVQVRGRSHWPSSNYSHSNCICLHIWSQIHSTGNNNKFIHSTKHHQWVETSTVYGCFKNDLGCSSIFWINDLGCISIFLNTHIFRGNDIQSPSMKAANSHNSCTIQLSWVCIHI